MNFHIYTISMKMHAYDQVQCNKKENNADLVLTKLLSHMMCSVCKRVLNHVSFILLVFLLTS